jgi:DNA end-binding protein Ku
VVEWNDVVRGYEYGPDNYVVMEGADFEKVPVSSTHTIEITQFVQLDEVDPIHYERSYYLEPDPAGAKPYALLRETLVRTGRVAVRR